MKKNEIYPMCEDQPAQIDCRIDDCIFYKGSGKCSNVSPAITLNPNGTFSCWSKTKRNHFYEKDHVKLYPFLNNEFHLNNPHNIIMAYDGFLRWQLIDGVTPMKDKHLIRMIDCLMNSGVYNHLSHEDVAIIARNFGMRLEDYKKSVVEYILLT